MVRTSQTGAIYILGAIYSPVYKSTASLFVRLISLLLVFASQKIVHGVRDEMKNSFVLLRKEIKDGLSKQGRQYIRGLHRKGLPKRGRKFSF